MADLIDIVLPADQTEGTTNTVGRWFKSVGDRVEANDPLLEITTDKVTVEIAAPGAGVLEVILKAEGESVEPGDVVGRIGTSGTDRTVETDRTVADRSDVSVSSVPSASSDLSPAVRRLLKQHGLDAAKVKGSGKGGRITVEDVESAVGGQTVRQSDSPTHHGRRIPHSTMRKTIAAHMVHSVATAPHVTSVFEADMTAVMAHREANKSALAGEGVRLTYSAYFIQAMVEAVRGVPEANARWHDDGLEIWDDINVGLATALGSEGLIVPVLRQAQTLDLAGTARAVHDLTERARAGSLTPRDVQDGTITMSNHGVSGSLMAAPVIINQPQSAILGVGRLQLRPVVRDGALVARPMIYVTLTIDHRVLDGFSANAFLTKWVETIERWT